MDGTKEPGFERGVLAATAEVWDRTAQRATVIGQLASLDRAGLDRVDAAATLLALSRRQVYLLMQRWRAGEGLVSDLLPRRAGAPRGGGHLPPAVDDVIHEAIRTHYLSRQRHTVAAVQREVARLCRLRGLSTPSRGSLVRRIAQVDSVERVSRRQGADSARALQSAGGVVPPVRRLLERVQIDHTVIDVIVVDERERQPVGRPYLSIGLDEASRSCRRHGRDLGAAVGHFRGAVPGPHGLR